MLGTCAVYGGDHHMQVLGRHGAALSSEQPDADRRRLFSCRDRAVLIALLGGRLTLVGLMAFAFLGSRPTRAQSAEPICHSAAVAEERKSNLPPGLLLAIGRVESGRLDPATGHVTAWPWTINANGVGRLFETSIEALAYTRALRERGTLSIDVGCFQINLLHHPAAFATLEEAFDPQANAAYAAHFLLDLRSRTGSWEQAVAAYHSSTPELGEPYRNRVMANFTGLGGSLPPSESMRPRVIWTATSPTEGVRVWTPTPHGMAPFSITIKIGSNRSETMLPTTLAVNPPDANGFHK